MRFRASGWSVATAVIAVTASLCLITGWLPGDAALALAERTLPVLGFVAAMTVVAELASAAGVFQALAERIASWGRGRVWALWALVLAALVLCTAVFSLDTTAVLLTPVVVALARHVRVGVLPFALATVYLANTASLFLPVSNLTNLLAIGQLQASPLQFLGMVWAPALIGVLVPVVWLSLVYRRQLGGQYQLAPAVPVQSKLLQPTVWVLLVLLPMLLTGLPVWIPATGAAVLLVLLFASREPGALLAGLLPWRALILAAGLFVVIETAQQQGLSALLARVSNSGNSYVDLLHLAGVGALASNLINNLPAYLALEPLARQPDRLLALLIGVNLGPLVTPWASLATLLWHDRLRALNVHLSWRVFLLHGAVLTVLVVPIAVLVLS